MRWPPWPFSSSSASNEPRSSQVARDNTHEGAPKISWSSPNLPTTWQHYAQPSVIVPTRVMTSSILVGSRLYKLYLRRIPGATRIGSTFWRRRSLFGRVTSVGDGDGFRLFHTPGGRLAGWGWLPWRRVPTGRELKNQTISIRLAGIDAPETAHFGKPAQAGGQEAMDWLTGYIHKRRVRAYVLKKDQYDRAVATVKVWRWLWRRDVGLEMLKRGLATVYEAKSGAEFGSDATEKRYRKAEAWAQTRKKGIWRKKNGAGWESPREFKARTKDSEVK